MTKTVQFRPLDKFSYHVGLYNYYKSVMEFKILAFVFNFVFVG